MSLAINFQLLVEKNKEKKTVSLKEWNSYGLLPFQPGFPKGILNQGGAKGSFTINHMVDAIDQALSDAFTSDGLDLHLNYQNIIEDDGEICLMLDVVCKPPLNGIQKMTFFNLLNEVLDDFPDGFCLLGTKGRKILVHLQPIAMEIDNDTEDNDF